MESQFPRIWGKWMQKRLSEIQFKLRQFWFIKVRKQLKSLEPSGAVLPATIKHNIKSLMQCNLRMYCLIKPLSAIEVVDYNSKILVIGPRNEHDLFLLGKEGFRNVRGVDLISYSSFIDLADMHKLVDLYGEAEFDIVLCGFTISYSTDPKLVAEQIAKVCKPNGLIGVSVEYSIDDPSLDEEWEKFVGYSLVDREALPEKINSVDQILGLFNGIVGHVYFANDAPRKRGHRPKEMVSNPSTVAVIFQKN